MKHIKISNIQTAKHVTERWYSNNGVYIHFIHRDTTPTITVFQKIKTWFK